jgi:RNAse (barnase) inhibitor barstar
MKSKSSKQEFWWGIESVSLDDCRVQASLPAAISTKSQLLDALQVALSFPDYFGRNWDALSDCICDLSWFKPKQVVLIHRDIPLMDDNGSFRIYLEILQDAVQFWTARREHELLVVFPEASKKTVLDILDGRVSPYPEILNKLHE